MKINPEWGGDWKKTSHKYCCIKEQWETKCDGNPSLYCVGDDVSENIVSIWEVPCISKRKDYKLNDDFLNFD